MAASKAFEKAKAKVLEALAPNAGVDGWCGKMHEKVKALEDWPVNSAQLRNVSVRYKVVILRAELAEKFPALKFSVRTEHFSGGSAINVHWKGKIEGSEEHKKALLETAEKVVRKYSNAGDTDAMVDYFDYDNYVDFNEDFDQKYGKKEAEAPAVA